MNAHPLGQNHLPDGGAAFPTLDYSESGHPYSDSPGMSLRDWFAGQAVCGYLAWSPSVKPESLAEFAYKVADAMLAKRAKPAG